MLLYHLKSDRFNRLTKEFTLIAFGQVVSVLGALVGIRILTGLLVPAEYGQLALGMTVATFTHYVVLGPLSNGATRFYAPASELGCSHIYLTVVRGAVLSASFAIFSGFIFLELVLVSIGKTSLVWLVAAAMVFALLSGYNGVLNGIQNAARQRAIVALHQGLASWGRFLVAAGFMLWLGATSTVAMLGYALAMLIVLASQYYFFRDIIKSDDCSGVECQKTSGQWRSQLFGYSWPFATWGVLGWGRTVADRWGLEFFSSTDEVGLYSVLFQLGYYPIVILIGMVTKLLEPIYFQRAGDGTDKKRLEAVFIFGWRTALISIATLSIFVGISFFLHQQIFTLFVAREYSHISYLLPGMMLSAVLYESRRFLSIVLKAQNLTKILIFPNNISHLIGMVLIFSGAAWNGLEGVVVAYVIQALIPLIWLSVIFKRQHKQIRIELERT